jgi:hypothetical protein
MVASREPPELAAVRRSKDRDRPTLPAPPELEARARERAEHADERVAPSDRPTEPAPEDPSSQARLRTRRAIPLVRSDTERIRADMAEKFFAADYVAALALAEDLVMREPTDTSAKDFAEECRRMLERAYAIRIGSLDHVPELAISLRELQSRSLDHQAGFLLSRVDGVSSLEALLDVCAMPRLDALRLVAMLVGDGVLRIRE